MISARAEVLGVRGTPLAAMQNEIRGASGAGHADETGAAVEKQDCATLDLTHLSRQCLGDRELETDLLLLFQTQASRLAAELAEHDRLSPLAQADIAHRLKGSALAVGAPAVAIAAEAVEICGRASGQGDSSGVGRAADMSQAIARLTEAVSQAAGAIARLLVS